eukprot:1230631-Prymnesium_polylepis.1
MFGQRASVISWPSRLRKDALAVHSVSQSSGTSVPRSEALMFNVERLAITVPLTARSLVSGLNRVAGTAMPPLTTGDSPGAASIESGRPASASCDLTMNGWWTMSSWSIRRPAPRRLRIASSAEATDAESYAADAPTCSSRALVISVTSASSITRTTSVAVIARASEHAAGHSGLPSDLT